MEENLASSGTSVLPCSGSKGVKYTRAVYFPVEPNDRRHDVDELPLMAWHYVRCKAEALANRGYKVTWLSTDPCRLEVHGRDGSRQLKANVLFIDRPASWCVDEGRVAELLITSGTAVLYRYAHGPDVNRLEDDPQARVLCDAIVDDMLLG
jgi:hypothetical protein